MKPHVVVEKNMQVAMRDKVCLATDWYRAADQQEPLPAILLRTPYDKEAYDRVALAQRWAEAGYAFVVQDCRGRFGSEGTFKLGQHEAEDGYDTIEWIAAQPWCNGRVGTVGTSYMAWVQSALATLSPPHLTCMWIHEGIANGLKESVRQGGAFELRWMGWAFYGAATDPHLTEAERLTLQRVDLRDWLQPRLPVAGESPLALAPNMEQWYLDYLRQGTDQGPLSYRGINIEQYYGEHADVPTVYSGGWYDSYTRATIRNWAALSTMKQSPQFLLMGPWTHGSTEPGHTYAGNIDCGADAAIDYFEVRRQWFDYWLKGQGENPLPPVRYFLMGGGSGQLDANGRLQHGGHWIDSAAWPPPTAHALCYYGTVGGKLVEEVDNTAGTIHFDADPNHPVPTIGGNISFLKYLRPIPEELWPLVPVADRLEHVSPIGGQDQVTYPGLFGACAPFGPLNQRRDVASFVSDPLSQPLVVTGPVSVQLTIASTAPDFDITVKLIDWYPPSADHPIGYALNITDGILRARFRYGTQSEYPYEPNTPITVVIDCYPTANCFMTGHRVRLDIAGSNFPRFDVNPNTGASLGDTHNAQVAHQSLIIAPDRLLTLQLTGYHERATL